jgi:hypothetical protein
MTSTQVFVGIDVSKKQWNLAFRPEGWFAAPNDEAGFAQVIERLSTVSPALWCWKPWGGWRFRSRGIGCSRGPGRGGQSPAGAGLCEGGGEAGQD